MIFRERKTRQLVAEHLPLLLCGFHQPNQQLCQERRHLDPRNALLCGARLASGQRSGIKSMQHAQYDKHSTLKIASPTHQRLLIDKSLAKRGAQLLVLLSNLEICAAVRER